MKAPDILRLPPLSCDTHSHIYGDPDACPVLPGHRHDPGTTLDDYLGVAAPMGLERLVLVQPKAYGQDPACMLDAIARLGVSRARGIIMPDDTLSSDDLQRLHDGGIRGVRFLFPDAAAIDVPAIRRTAAQVTPLGWSLIVQGGGPALATCVDDLLRLPCPVIIDHLGRVPAGHAVDSPVFQALLRFVREGGWFKLSAPYYGTPNGEADFRMLESRIHALLDAGIERLVWGMNWPHPNFLPGNKPDDLSSLRSFLSVLRSPSDVAAVFVRNPARLYGFTR
jgi:predicted TIM-barrel fold metal-dependent hydrolase